MATNGWRAPSIGRWPLQRGLGWHPGERLEALFDAERDQLPLWLPVGLALGIAAWFWLPNRHSWIAFLFLAGGLCAASFAAAPRTRWGRSLGIFLLAAMLGCGLIWWKAAAKMDGPSLRGSRMVRIVGRVEAVQPLPANEAVRLLVAPEGERRLPRLLRINADQDKVPPGIAAGARVRLRLFLMPPPAMAVPGAYDFSRTAWFQGIGGSGKALDSVELVEAASTPGWKAWLADARQRLAAHIRERIPGGPGGIAAALATGDQGGISKDDSDAMRRSGLAHLLSVSGLHLTAVVGAVMVLTLRLLALSPTLALRYRLVLVAAGAGAVAGIAYTLLTGAEVPTVRSLIASLLILLGIALGREALTLRLVATGALVVLLLWPDSLAGPSFQLSFAAIIAIVALHEHAGLKRLLSRRDEGPFKRLGRNMLGLVLTGLAVELALMPIALFHFHKAGIYGAGANILAIPLTTFVTMPFEALALMLDPLGLGSPFWWVTGKSLELLLWMARTTATAPGAVAMLPNMPSGAFALIVGGGLWLALWRTKWRVWGLAPIAIGGAWALATPAPDLIVTGDGRHLALRTESGKLAILRGRAGDYVRNMLGETAGSDAPLLDLDMARGARCSQDACIADIGKDGRRWRVLATRSVHMIDTAALAPACAMADIVISERRLPHACTPRWFKADKSILDRTGGLSITLGANPRVETVADQVGEHPWAQSYRAGQMHREPRRYPHK